MNETLEVVWDGSKAFNGGLLLSAYQPSRPAPPPTVLAPVEARQGIVLSRGWMALEVMSRQWQNAQTIGAALGITKDNARSLLDRMVKRNLVERYEPAPWQRGPKRIVLYRKTQQRKAGKLWKA